MGILMITKNFHDLTWQEFCFDEIFDIKNGFYNKKPESSNSGKIPFLGATAVNNGITGFFPVEKIEKSSKMGHGKNHSLKKKIFEGNCIAVTNNGSVGHAYYQKNEFTCSHDINPLYLRDHKLNRYIALFLIALIEKQRICFEYSRKWRPMRMKNSRIMIPVTNQGKPDWTFMESYVKIKEKIVVDKHKTYLNNRILAIQDDNSPTLEYNFGKNLKWCEFLIEDLFQVRRGKRLTKKDRKPGNIAFYSAAEYDNGVTDFISNPLFVEKNKILVTIFGDAFFAEGEFTASDDVTILDNNLSLINIMRCLFVR
jgi:hypothetical protein